YTDSGTYQLIIPNCMPSSYPSGRFSLIVLRTAVSAARRSAGSAARYWATVEAVILATIPAELCGRQASCTAPPTIATGVAAIFINSCWCKVRAGLAHWRSRFKLGIGSFALPHCRRRYRDDVKGPSENVQRSTSNSEHQTSSRRQSNQPSPRLTTILSR